MIRFSPHALALGALLLSLSVPAEAQERRGRTITVGLGAQVKPEYPGADDLSVGPLPIFDIRRTGDPLTFEAPDEGIGMGLLGDGVFNIGPAIQFEGKRKQKDVGAPVGNVGFTVEVGGFVEYYAMPNFRLRAEGRRGLGGHEAWVGDVSADFVIRDRDNYVFSIGPRARLSDGKYQRAYFGVTPAAAAASGLPAYRPGGGVHAVGVAAGLTRMIGRNWGIYGEAGYDRLIGDAADSPLVRQLGSRDQFSAGLGLFYSFDVGG